MSNDKKGKSKQEGIYEVANPCVHCLTTGQTDASMQMADAVSRSGHVRACQGSTCRMLIYVEHVTTMQMARVNTTTATPRAGAV